MLDYLKQTYQGKKVFLTGHTGFKGAWLLKTLNLLGADVKGYSLEPKTKNDLFYLINGDQICESKIADLRDKKTLNKDILDFQPDFIFHLAAQPLVRLSYEIPSETFEVNAIGTANLLDAIRNLEKKCSVVLITTDKVYHNNEWEYPYRENDMLGGYDPYSASKACAELIIECYRNSFFPLAELSVHGKGIAVGRAGNVIGGGDWSKDRLIPDVARAVIKGNKVSIRNPDSIRPWQHVIEPIVGYLILGAKIAQNPSKYSKPFNFGPNSNDALPVLEMVKLALNYWEKGSYELNKITNQPHEANLLKLDISKAIKVLDWKPQMNALEAIIKTISWYKVFEEDVSRISSFTSSQIINHLQRYK